MAAQRHEISLRVLKNISRVSPLSDAGLFASITSAEFKRNFTLKRRLMNRQLIKRIPKLLNFPPFWEKVFLTPAVPLSYQK